MFLEPIVRNKAIRQKTAIASIQAKFEPETSAAIPEEQNVSKHDKKLAAGKGATHSKKTSNQLSQDAKDIPENGSMAKKSESKKGGKPPKVKIEKPAKSQKSGSEAGAQQPVSTLNNGVSKPELVIPEIVIPVNKIKIPRTDGPSPWNGTIKYDNKVFLGAHISAAGCCFFLNFPRVWVIS